MKTNNITVITPPQYKSDYKCSIFLAGSIELINGQATAAAWQREVIMKLDAALSGARGVVVHNPRRADWDSSWGQTTADANFVEQVSWELDHIVSSDFVIVYFDPETKSPISLMELGIIGGSDINAVVVCPDGYWKKGNVDITCGYFDVPMVDTLDDAVLAAAKFIKSRTK